MGQYFRLKQKIQIILYIFPSGYLQTDPDSDRERLALLAAALRRSQSTGDLEDHDPDDPEPGGDHGGLTLGHTSTEHEVVRRSVCCVFKLSFHLRTVEIIPEP